MKFKILALSSGSVIAGLMLTALTWFRYDRVAQNSFFSLYRGIDFEARGAPWWYWWCIENDRCEVLVQFLILDVLVWSTLSLLSLLFVQRILPIVKLKLMD